MKKLSKLLGVLLVGLVFGVTNVYADAVVTVKNTEVICGSGTGIDPTDYTLKPGGETICTVYVTPNADLAASVNSKLFSAQIIESEYLTVSNVVANSAAGFTNASGGTSVDLEEKTTTGGEKYKTFVLYYNGTLTADTQVQVLSFTLKLSADAANLLETQSCGQMCFAGSLYDTQLVKGYSDYDGTVDTRGYCSAPTINLDPCTGDDCGTTNTDTPKTKENKTENPKTGDFMDYCLVGGIACVALVGIISASKKKKFYNV